MKGVYKMKNWLLGQGIPFYAELLLAVSGLIVLWMTGRIYKRLLREADLMGSSNQKLIKYIRLKVASYFKTISSSAHKGWGLVY